jgi:hypothetical protein
MVPGAATSGKISVTNSFGTGTGATDFVVVPIVLNEDFVALTLGDIRRAVPSELVRAAPLGPSPAKLWI